MKIRFIIVFLIIFLTIFNCKTTQKVEKTEYIEKVDKVDKIDKVEKIDKNDPRNYIIEKFTPIEQSYILSNKGVTLYNELEKKLDYSKIPEIRYYFLNALYLYKNNEEAIKFLKKLNSFKQEKFNSMYETAIKYKNKENKTEQDIFNMCYFLQKMFEIDPNHIKAKKLKKEIQSEYDKLIKTYLDRANEVKEKLKTVTNQDEKDDLVYRGLDVTGRILLLNPDDENAKKEKNFYQSIIIDNINKIIDNCYKNIEKRNYSPIDNDIKKIEKYNSKIDNILKNEIANIQYQKNFTQAKDYFEKNNLSLARDRIKTALSYKTTKEAIDLQLKINSSIVSSSKDTTKIENISNSKKELAVLLSENEYSLAKDKINQLLEITKDENERNNLIKMRDEINNKIKDIVPKLYEDAITDYNNENYKDAIVKFRKVLDLDPQYEKANDYLDKSIKKQKALENL